MAAVHEDAKTGPMRPVLEFPEITAFIVYRVTVHSSDREGSRGVILSLQNQYGSVGGCSLNVGQSSTTDLVAITQRQRISLRHCRLDLADNPGRIPRHNVKGGNVLQGLSAREWQWRHTMQSVIPNVPWSQHFRLQQ